MPTPFYHLALAHDILSDPRLPPAVGTLLHDNLGAFLYGNTAPDVQTLSKQSREATHFFSVPFGDDHRAWGAMFARYPRLGNAGQLSPAHAAFMAGYCAHLLLDQMWIVEVFPRFITDLTGENRFQRFFWHNVLRIQLDRAAWALLTPATGAAIGAAPVADWLPFEQQTFVVQWRDFLAEQFLPGARIRTVEIFAERMRVRPDEFEQALADTEGIRAQLHPLWPPDAQTRFRERAITHTVALCAAYVAGDPPLDHIRVPRAS